MSGESLPGKKKPDSIADRRSPINSALQLLPREKTATDGILQIKTATPGASDTAVFLEDALTLYPR